MGVLFGGGSDDSNPPATSLRIQTSLNGQPIAIVHGVQRLAGNLIWYGGFAYSGSGKGGKGGGGGKDGAQPSYTVDMAMGVCEGPIVDIPTVWFSQSITTGVGSFSIFNGALEQNPWGFLTTTYPQYALGYSSLAYVASENLALGGSPELPNYTFEVRSAIGAAVWEAAIIPSSGPYYTVTPANFSLVSSVTEQLTVPATTPYQYNALNPFASNHVLVASGSISDGTLIPGSDSQGVIDIDGRVFTRDPNSAPPTASGHYTIINNSGIVTYTFHAADAGLDVTIIDLAVGPGVYGAFFVTGAITAGSAIVTGLTTSGLVEGQWVLGADIPSGTVIQSIGTGEITLSNAATVTNGSAALTIVVSPYNQVLGLTGASQFGVSVQPGSYGQYEFDSGNAGAQILIIDIPDADPAASLADMLSNPRYGSGFPAANIGDLSRLQDYAWASGLFISPALVGAQAANDYLDDFSGGLNGEFVWSSGLLTFVPYGDAAITGFGKSYTPPSVPIYSLDDDDFLKNESTASVGISAFTSDDPVVCVRKRPSDAYNDVKVEYLDRGNSYNPAIAEAQDDAAINLYGLRAADTKQLHFFCGVAPALMSAQLQLGRQQVRNLYSFTVPWYFILLDPMDIIAISDQALGLDEQWVRILEITENQQDGTLTITAEEYLQGTGSVPPYLGAQTSIGFTPNANATAPNVN